MDELVKQGMIQDNVFAQIGQSTYLPVHYQYERFLAVEEFKRYQESANLIISHGGTGALIGALRAGKQVIAVPRLAKYSEHTDDHQLQITRELSKMNFLENVEEILELKNILCYLEGKKYKKYNIESDVFRIVIDYIGNE